jgi:dolichol kinase
VNAAAPREDWRRALHVASGTVGLAPTLGVAHGTVTVILLSLVLAALMLEVLRRRHGRLRTALERLAGGALRPAESGGVTGASLLVTGYAVTWLLFPAAAASGAIVATAVADPAAATVGSLASRARGRKTWAGTAGAGVAAFLALSVLRRNWHAALAGAVAAALLERIPGRGVDNVVMPLGTAAILALHP